MSNAIQSFVSKRRKFLAAALLGAAALAVGGTAWALSQAGPCCCGDRCGCVACHCIESGCACDQGQPCVCEPGGCCVHCRS